MNRILRNLLIPTVVILALASPTAVHAQKKRVSQTDDIAPAVDRGATRITTQDPPVVSGGAGNDTIKGGKGNDDLHGNAGHDRISGGDGDDLLYGWLGDDFLQGDSGTDRLSGWLGEDVMKLDKQDFWLDADQLFDLKA